MKPAGIPPMTVDTPYPPVSITDPRPGVFVYDFGKSCSSRPALTVRGPAGRTIKLSPSEVLGVDGMIDPRSIGARPNLPVCYNYTLAGRGDRSEEHTSELQSLMRISYAVFCLKKKK